MAETKKTTSSTKATTTKSTAAKSKTSASAAPKKTASATKSTAPAAAKSSAAKTTAKPATKTSTASSSAPAKSSTPSAPAKSSAPAKTSTQSKSSAKKSSPRKRVMWGLNKISFYLLGAVAILYLIGLVLAAIDATKLATAVTILQALATAMMICVVGVLGWKYVRPKQMVWKVLYVMIMLIIVVGIIVPMCIK